jgi:RecB family exonuclease
VPPGWKPHYEGKVRLALDSEVTVRGRIDRYDVSPSGEVAVYDFKYSGGEAVRKKVRDAGEHPPVQGGLYLIALEQQQQLTPKSFHYVALRDEAREHGWEEPGEVRELMRQSRLLTLDAAARIRAGEIAAKPRDPALCAFCELRDACRIAVERQAEPAVSARGYPGGS